MSDYAVSALLAKTAADAWAHSRDIHSPQVRLDAYDAWTRAVEAGARFAGADDIGAVLANLADRPFRDAVVLSLLDELDPSVPLTMLTGAAPFEVIDPVRDRMLSKETGVRPGEFAFRAGDILDVVAAAAGDTPAAAAPFALLGLLAWWKYDMDAADLFTDKAVAADAFDGFAVAISRLPREGHRPGWVVRVSA